MTSCRTAPHGRLVEHPVVDGRGFAALRLAVALHRDGQLGPTLDPVAYRAASKTARSGAASTGSPSIPVPAPPSEPTGELATVEEATEIGAETARAVSGEPVRSVIFASPSGPVAAIAIQPALIDG